MAVCTDCAVLAPCSLAPGMATKDQALEGFGQRLGTGVLKEFDFNWIFRRALLLDSGCLEMQVFPLGACTGVDRGWPMESCSPWSAL